MNRGKIKKKEKEKVERTPSFSIVFCGFFLLFFIIITILLLPIIFGGPVLLALLYNTQKGGQQQQQRTFRTSEVKGGNMAGASLTPAEE